MIENISPVTQFYVELDADWCRKNKVDWTVYRANSDGTYWETLMGMSWEECDPPEEVIDEYKRLRNST